MKNYLVAIENEVKEHYKKLTFPENLEGQVEEFANSVVAIIDYYIEPIFNNGKNVVQKKLGTEVIKNNFTDNENSFITHYKDNVLIEFRDTLKEALAYCFEQDNTEELLEDLIEIIVGNCIRIFKYAQLSEFKNNDILEVYLLTDNDGCPLCQSKNSIVQNVESLMSEINNFHPFCKMIIESTNYHSVPKHIDNQIQALITKLKFSIPHLISTTDFKIVPDVILEEDFTLLLKNKYDDIRVNELLTQLRGQVKMFKTKDKVFISLFALNLIDYIICKSLIESEILAKDLIWWKEQYYQRSKNKYIGDNVAVHSKPFISYIAEQSYESYVVESAIAYILQPKVLKEIDFENYNRLKEFIFNGIEFLKE